MDTQFLHILQNTHLDFDLLAVSSSILLGIPGSVTKIYVYV